MKKILSLLLFVTLGFSLLACGQPDNSGNNGGENGGETGGEQGPYARTDKREAVYGVYSVDGEELGTYTSMYAAIINCVNDGYKEDYVARTDNPSEKLFINYEKYDEGNDVRDQFWHYDKTSLEVYKPWAATYWDELFDKNSICVYKNYDGGNNLDYHANGYKLVGLSSTNDAAEVTQVWNARYFLEANAVVHVDKFTGITKMSYDINLSEAEIYPSYKGSDKGWAYVGFETADAYNVSHNGLRCDTETGNWYYYSGEAQFDTYNITVDSSEIIATSTWDAEKGCFKPNSNVTLTMELLPLTEDAEVATSVEESSYIAHRLTILVDGKTYVRDYEYSGLTLCGSIRFECGLDIENQSTFPDYQCGSEFKNLVITRATASVLERTLSNPEIYYVGSNNVTQKPAFKTAGEFDMLNSNPESAARYHTMLYTPCCVTANYATAGKDVYSFSFDFE